MAKRTQSQAKPPAASSRPAQRKPAPPPVAPRPPLPAPLESALASVRATKTRTILGEGTARIILLLLGMLVVQGLLDWTLDFSRAARAALLLVDFLALGFATRRWLATPWHQRYNDTAAALAIQRTWPALGSRIIAAVQLVRPEAQGSRLLIDKVIADAGQRLAALPLKQVVPTRLSQRLLLAAFTATFAIGGLITFGGIVPSTLFQRVLLSNLQLPTDTQVAAVTEDIKGAAGADFKLAALALGKQPARGRVEITYADGQQRTFTAQPRLAEPGVFELPLPNVQQSFTYRFYLGDGRGLKYQTSVRPAPLLTKVKFTQNYPAYTGRPALLSGPGPLNLFAGSTVSVAIESSSVLSHASILLNGEAPIPMNITRGPDKTASATFDVPAKALTGLSIALVNDAGIMSAGDTVYPVKVEFDAPPVIKITQPSETESTMLAASSLPILARVTDNYGLAQVALVTELRGTGDSPAKIERIPLLLTPESSLLSTTFEPAQQTPPWPEGTTGTWWLEATDNNASTGPGITSSSRFQVTVLSPAAKRQELLEKVNALSARIEEIAGEQQKARETIQDVLRKNQSAP